MKRNNLEQPEWFSHGALDVQAPHLQKLIHIMSIGYTENIIR
jgi:hypothetical protein